MSPVRSPRASAKTSPSSRERIVAAAVTCFRKRGFVATRSAEIALEAGVDQPLINYHFPRIESLHAEVITLIGTRTLEYVRSRLARLRAPHDTGVDALRAYVRAYFEWYVAEPELCSLWLYYYHWMGRDAEARERNGALRAAGRERVSLMLYRLLEEGRWAPPVPQPGEDGHLAVGDLADQIIGIVTGNVLLAATGSGGPPLEFADKTWLAVTRILRLAPEAAAPAGTKRSR
jgi:AcrR family transcriptional regulator